MAKEPMMLSELKKKVDSTLEMRGGRDLTICIPNNKVGMGGTPVTNIISASGGIDWDVSKFFLYPEVKMIEQPPNFTESEFQRALLRIKSIEGVLSRLIDAIGGHDAKHLTATVAFSKSTLEQFKKKPITSKK